MGEGPTALSTAGHRGVSKCRPESWAPKEGTRVKKPPHHSARAEHSSPRSGPPRQWAPVPGLPCDSHCQTLGPPMHRAPTKGSAHSTWSALRDAPTTKTGRGAQTERAGPGLKPRQTPGPLHQQPAHLTPKQPQDPILPSGPPGAWPRAWHTVGLTVNGHGAQVHPC